MAERDIEIADLKARIADLEARPTAQDIDWLKNSNVWRRAELAASPQWFKVNLLIMAVLLGILIFAFMVG